MLVQTMLNQLRNFPPPTGRDNRQVGLLTMGGPVVGKVITGYNYDAEARVVTIFASGNHGSGMPANLLIHSMEVQSIPSSADVQWENHPVLAMIPATSLSSYSWTFEAASPGGTTANLIKVGEQWRLRVFVELDVEQVRELGEWAIENPDHYLYPVLQTLHGKTCDALGVSDL